MKKIFLVTGGLVLVAMAGYLAYQVYLPKMIAESLTSEPNILVPDDIQDRIQKVRKPVNEGAEAVVETMHKSGVTMDQILKAIDDASEEQAFAFLDELNESQVDSSDQVFSLAKKYFPVDFDVEIFRRPFNENVSIAHIRKGIHYANIYKEKEEFDVSTAKSIVKRILLQKEEEFKRLTKIN